MKENKLIELSKMFAVLSPDMPKGKSNIPAGSDERCRG